MKQKRHRPEEMIRLLRECDSSELNQESYCRQKQISLATLHRWKKKYGGLGVSELRELKAIREENRRLKTLAADLSLDKTILQEALRIKW